MRVRMGLAVGAAVLLVLGGCGGGSSARSPVTLGQAESNLQKAGYKLTVYSPGGGVLQIDSTHTASAGFSVNHAPDGADVYSSVFETTDPAVRKAILAQNDPRSDAKPVLRGNLIFTLSGSDAALHKLVQAAGD